MGPLHLFLASLLAGLCYPLAVPTRLVLKHDRRLTVVMRGGSRDDDERSAVKQTLQEILGDGVPLGEYEEPSDELLQLVEENRPSAWKVRAP